MEKSRRQREWAVTEFIGVGITKYFLKLNICRWGMGKRRELLLPIFG